MNPRLETRDRLMYVSVRASALRRAGYPSLIDGLNDLALHRVETDVAPCCEAPRLGAGEPCWVSIADEGSARAYRQHLYEHAVSVSALRLTRPPGPDAGEAMAADVQLVVQAADMIGAPVVCVETAAEEEPGSGGWTTRLQDLDQQTAGMRALLAFSFADASRHLDAALSALDDETARAGLALEVEALVGGAPSSECAYDSLRALAPYVRCVSCGAARGGGPRPGSARPLAESMIDYARVACMLGNAGYAGALTIAPAATDDARAARRLLRADAAYLKDIIGEL